MTDHSWKQPIELIRIHVNSPLRSFNKRKEKEIFFTCLGLDATLVTNEMNVPVNDPAETPNAQPITTDDEEKHRRQFLQLAFGPIPDVDISTQKTNPRFGKILTHTDYKDIVDIVRYWNLEEGHVDPDTGRHISMKEFRKSRPRSWYVNFKSYRIKPSTNKDSLDIGIVERLTDEKKDIWKKVVHIENVYDAIKECHEQDGHVNRVSTRDKVNEKYWNIPEKLCRIFVHTCPKCTSRKKTGRSPKITMEIGLRDRYNVRIIDFKTKQLRDRLNNRLLYVLIVLDNEKQWTILRPLTEIKRTNVETEILSVICASGYPRTCDESTVRTFCTIMANSAISGHEKMGRRTGLDVEENVEIPPEMDVQEEVFIRCEQRVKELIEMKWNQQKNSFLYPNWSTILNVVSMTINKSTETGVIIPPTRNDMLQIQPTNISTIVMPTIENDHWRGTLSSLTRNVTSPKRKDVPTPLNQDSVIDEKNTSTPLSQETDSGFINFHYTPQSPIDNIFETTKDKQVRIANDPNLSMTQSQSLLSQFANLFSQEADKIQLKALCRQPGKESRSFFTTDTSNATRNVGDDGADEIEVVNPSPNRLPSKRKEYPPDKFNGMSVSEAFSRKRTSTRTVQGVDFTLCHPQLVCEVCNEFAPSRSLTIGESNYYEFYRDEPNEWFFADMVTTFAILCCHDAHRQDMVYIDAMLPSVGDQSANKKPVDIPPRVRTIVSVVLKNDHFAVMRLCLEKHIVYFYDGLNKPISLWRNHAMYVLNRYGLNKNKWEFCKGMGKDGMQDVTIQQNDRINCGPIACIVIWKLFKPTEVDLTKFKITEYRYVVVNEMERLLRVHDAYCILYTRKQKEDDTASLLYDDKSSTNVSRKKQRPTVPTPGVPRVARLPHPMLDASSSNNADGSIDKVAEVDATIEPTTTLTLEPTNGKVPTASSTMIEGSTNKKHDDKASVNPPSSKQMDPVGKKSSKTKKVVTEWKKTSTSKKPKKESLEPTEKGVITDFFATKKSSTRQPKKDKVVPKSEEEERVPEYDGCGLVESDDDFVLPPPTKKKKPSTPVGQGVSKDVETPKVKKIKNRAVEKIIEIDKTPSKTPKSPSTLQVQRTAKKVSEPSPKRSIPDPTKDTRPSQTPSRPKRRVTKKEACDGLLSDSDDEENQFVDDVVPPVMKDNTKPPRRSTPDSDAEDDDFIDEITPRHVKEKIASASTIKKPRIKIPADRVKRLSGNKCSCKKKCTKHCGCVKAGQKCTVACACGGNCTNAETL